MFIRRCLKSIINKISIMLMVPISIHIRFFLTYKPFFLSLFITFPLSCLIKPFLVLHSRKLILHPFENKNSIILCGKKDNKHVTSVKSRSGCKYFKLIRFKLFLVTLCHLILLWINSYLVLYTHLTLINFLKLGKLISSHVLFLLIEWISSFIALNQQLSWAASL